MELPRHTRRTKKRKSIRAFSIGTVLLVTSLLGSFFQNEPQSQAATLNVLETLGIGIVAGTVLGASTLPFYDEPGQHTGNIALGAAIGAGVGLGLVLARSIFGVGGGSESMARVISPSSGAGNASNSSALDVDFPRTGLRDNFPNLVRAERSLKRDPVLFAGVLNQQKTPLASLPLVSLRW